MKELHGLALRSQLVIDKSLFSFVLHLLIFAPQLLFLLPNNCTINTNLRLSVPSPASLFLFLPRLCVCVCVSSSNFSSHPPQVAPFTPSSLSRRSKTTHIHVIIIYFSTQSTAEKHSVLFGFYIPVRGKTKACSCRRASVTPENFTLSLS